MMGKCLRLLLILVVFVTCFGNSVDAEAAKKTVAVTGVENNIRNSYGRKAAQELDAALTTVLVQSGVYNVLERGQLEHVIREMELQSTGMITGHTAIQFGQMTGSDYSVIGNVVAADVARFRNSLYKGRTAKIKFNLKFVDNKTGMIKIAEMIEGSETVSEYEDKTPDKDMMLSNAASDVARKVMHKINNLNPITGRVLKVNNKTVYINLGTTSGVRSGETYLLYKEGEPIMDPVTGEIIAVEEIIVGKVKIESVSSKYSIGVLKKGKGKVDSNCKVKRG